MGAFCHIIFKYSYAICCGYALGLSAHIEQLNLIKYIGKGLYYGILQCYFQVPLCNMLWLCIRSLSTY